MIKAWEEPPNILVGLCVHKPDRRFLETLPIFSQSISERNLANLSFFWVWDKILVDAQNEIADKFLSGTYDYLLFIEDDHWGFTSDMLEACIYANSDVSTISYRSRHFPFEMIPMKYENTDKNGVRRFTGLDFKKGYHEADLCGFGFTLIKRYIFEKLERPYFRLNNEYFKGVGPHATDIDFCFRVQNAGGKIVGNFDFILPHRDLDEKSYQRMIIDGILAKHSMFTRINQLFSKNRKEKSECTTNTALK